VARELGVVSVSQAYDRAEGCIACHSVGSNCEVIAQGRLCCIIVYE
jgi:hypothetical protein